MTSPADQHQPIGVVLSKPPYGSHFSHDALDALMALAIYGQPVSVFIVGDGVWQLLNGQQAQAIEQKSFNKLLDALVLYDVEHVYVCQTSLQQRSLTSDDLSLEIVTLLSANDLSEKMHCQHTLLSF